MKKIEKVEKIEKTEKIVIVIVWLLMQQYVHPVELLFLHGEMITCAVSNITESRTCCR